MNHSDHAKQPKDQANLSSSRYLFYPFPLAGSQLLTPSAAGRWIEQMRWQQGYSGKMIAVTPTTRFIASNEALRQTNFLYCDIGRHSECRRNSSDRIFFQIGLYWLILQFDQIYVPYFRLVAICGVVRLYQVNWLRGQGKATQGYSLR